MSHRPSFEKKMRRFRKQLGRKRLPAYIDIIEWLKDHGHAQTTGEAIRLLLDERVKSESHTVGLRPETVLVGETLATRNVVSRYVPAGARSTLYVRKT